MAYRNVFEIQKPWALEVVRCINEWWAKYGWDANEWQERIRAQLSDWNQWVDEPMNQWISESMNQWSNNAMTQWFNQTVNPWIDESVNQRLNESVHQWLSESVIQSVNESMNQCTSELVSRWLNDSLNQWTNESLIQWTIESMNQWTYEPTNLWISESVNPWTYETMNQWTKEWRDPRMGEPCEPGELPFLYFLCWASSSLSDLFAEAPLLSATSSLSSLLSGLLLLWPCSELPPAMNSRSYYDAFSNLQLQSRYSTKRSTMVKNYLPRSCYIVFGNLQLQAHLPQPLARRVAASLMLCCA